MLGCSVRFRTLKDAALTRQNAAATPFWSVVCPSQRPVRRASTAARRRSRASARAATGRPLAAGGKGGRPATGGGERRPICGGGEASIGAGGGGDLSGRGRGRGRAGDLRSPPRAPSDSRENGGGPNSRRNAFLARGLAVVPELARDAMLAVSRRTRVVHCGSMRQARPPRRDSRELCAALRALPPTTRANGPSRVSRSQARPSSLPPAGAMRADTAAASTMTVYLRSWTTRTNIVLNGRDWYSDLGHSRLLSETDVTSCTGDGGRKWELAWQATARRGGGPSTTALADRISTFIVRGGGGFRRMLSRRGAAQAARAHLMGG